VCCFIKITNLYVEVETKSVLILETSLFFSALCAGKANIMQKQKHELVRCYSFNLISSFLNVVFVFRVALASGSTCFLFILLLFHAVLLFCGRR
jgi:hypothetical protein